MISVRTPEYLCGLLKELCKLPKETEWVEFKQNRAAAEEIGEYLSALANAAALAGKATAYVVWGVSDGDHEIVGTTFDPTKEKVGNEELENWLLRLLTPKIDFRFFPITVADKAVVLLELERANHQPVSFQGKEFIRVGTYKKKLKDFPERERALWRLFDKILFEDGVAAEHCSEDEVLKKIDYPSYFDLLQKPLPDHKRGILEALEADKMIRRCDAGGWNITNLGAVLFSRRLDDFGPVGRKALRVIVYKGNSRVETVKEQVGAKGYACGFETQIAFINGVVPANEVVGQAIRKTVPMYPELAVRELVANALIHQDFTIRGAGPMVEIFSDRMEITNPGRPLVAPERFLDSSPRSRNETLASLTRRMGICEERGSGIDKVVLQTEMFQLPAPLFEVTGDSTRAVLFAHRPLTKMDKDDRIRACYLHACLKYVSHDFLTNSSVRERFGIASQNIALASRMIKEAIENGAIVAHDRNAAPKLMKYVPWWAAGPRSVELLDK